MTEIFETFRSFSIFYLYIDEGETLYTLSFISLNVS